METIKNELERLQLYVELVQERNKLRNENKILLVVSIILTIILMCFVVILSSLINLI